MTMNENLIVGRFNKLKMIPERLTMLMDWGPSKSAN